MVHTYSSEYHVTHPDDTPRLRHQPLAAAWLEHVACLGRTGEVFLSLITAFLYGFLSIHSTWFHPLVSYHATSMCLLSHNTLEISGFSGLQLWRPEMDCQLMSTIRRHGLGCLLLWGVLWYCEQKWGSLAGMRHWFNLQHYLKNNNNKKKTYQHFPVTYFFR